MASIIKRRKKFSVVYRYTDENGNERQKWESFDTMAEAKKRKLEVEFKQVNNEFIAPSMKTINDLLAQVPGAARATASSSSPLSSFLSPGLDPTWLSGPHPG